MALGWRSIGPACALLAALAAVAGPAAAAPEFQPAPCWFAVPDGESATCGRVSLPDRNGSAPVVLPVAVLRARTDSPHPDPVLFLEGGPGASPFGSVVSGDEKMERWWADSRAIRRARDLVLFDPRGVGRATPAADCPELDALAAQPEDRPLARHRRESLESVALRACAERLAAEGVDPAAFSTPQAADDALAVADALGAERVNLLAVSYGTRVALEALRRHGGRVRAAVLDSVYPPDVNALEEEAWLAWRGMRRLFDDCQANRFCRATFPDLERRFLRLAARLDLAPVDAPLDASEHPHMVRFDGAALTLAVLQAMADGETAPLLPRMIAAAADGQLGDLAAYAAGPWLGAADTAEGAAFAIECRETVNPADPARLAEARRRWAPYGAVAAEHPGLRVCPVWPAGEQAAPERLPVAGTVPVLILSGAYDAFTPPEWGDRAAKTLPRSRHMVFRAAGHAVFFIHACARAAAAGFIESADPARAPLCPQAERRPRFR